MIAVRNFIRGDTLLLQNDALIAEEINPDAQWVLRLSASLTILFLPFHPVTKI